MFTLLLLSSYRCSFKDRVMSGEMRVEHDTLGSVEVPAERLYGAQTARSLHFFHIGLPMERMPILVVHSLARVKAAAAKVNAENGSLDRRLADAIVTAADEVLSGALDEHFPLSVWQTGSGTQTNMNVNEVSYFYSLCLLLKISQLHYPILGVEQSR